LRRAPLPTLSAYGQSGRFAAAVVEPDAPVEPALPLMPAEPLPVEGAAPLLLGAVELPPAALGPPLGGAPVVLPDVAEPVLAAVFNRA
jgi:hypothetical protein